MVGDLFVKHDDVPTLRISATRRPQHLDSIVGAQLLIDRGKIGVMKVTVEREVNLLVTIIDVLLESRG